MPTERGVLAAFPTPDGSAWACRGRTRQCGTLGFYKVLSSASGRTGAGRGRWTSIIPARLSLTMFNVKARGSNLHRFWPPLAHPSPWLWPPHSPGVFPLRCGNLSSFSSVSPRVTRAEGATQPPGSAEILPPYSLHGPGCLCFLYKTPVERHCC